MQANTKEPHSVTVYIQVNHGSLQWGQGSTLGMFLTGQGWEGEVSGRGFSYGGTHTGTKWWTMCIPPPGAGGCLLGPLNKGVLRLSIDMAHTHTQTQENMPAMQCKSLNYWQYQSPSLYTFV